MINRLLETTPSVEVQDTTFSIDVLGRYICNTWEEAVNNGGVAFDAVVIGAGMFGAYCAEKLYRNSNLRVLVLDAGSFLISEHTQNLSRIGLSAPKAAQVPFNIQDPGTRERVWGIPWRSQVAFPGLAYCLGGRSLYWGGWSPRLTAADLANWPAEVANYLQNSAGSGDAYEIIERETGIFDKTDYISGPLFQELFERFRLVAGTVPSVDAVEEAPLAIQASPPASGLFSFDKYSSAPILTDAIREAAASPDWCRRLFLVPRTHVVKLHTSANAVTGIEAYTNGQRKFLSISPQCAVVLASGTIESTRLALESFPTPLMGRNLVAHLRSNTIVRIHRAAFDAALPRKLEAAALLVRGSSPQGRYHLQVTAAAVTGSDSEVTMFRMIPDIDLVEQILASQTADWIVITLRGIGEMKGNQDHTLPKITGNSPSWIDLSDQTDQFGMRRAWVNLAKHADDDLLWRVMDDAAILLAKKLAGDNPDHIEYFYNKDGAIDAPGANWHKDPPPASLSNDRKNPNNKVRDGLGTTHHEAGSLWMGNDPARSVTDVNGLFHHISNAYVAGPALFPTIGSANPSLTALSLARRTTLAIVQNSLNIEPGFTPLGNGGLNGWRMAGVGTFIELGGNIIETDGGTGLLWYTREEFTDFVLKLEWRSSSLFDNSGVYLRCPALDGDWTIADREGYEVQIDERGLDEAGNAGSLLHTTGAVYKLAPRVNTFPLPTQQWNTFEIQALGPEITVKIDGQLVSRLQNGNRSLKGHIGLQNHHPGSRVQFRNIRIKKL